MRLWIIGIVAWIIGLTMGSLGVFFFVKLSEGPQGKASLEKNEPEDIPDPKVAPTEAEGLNAFKAILAEARLEVQVLKFHRTDWKTYPISRDENGPLAQTYRIYKFYYEAEIEFRQERLIREGFRLNWNQRSSDMLVDAGTYRFKKGERKIIHGGLTFEPVEGQWRLDPKKNQIEAPL